MDQTITITCNPDCGCEQHVRLRELAGLTESVADYNLVGKYRHFNQTLFNGKLPEIPISWATLKNVGGRVTYKITREASAPRMGKYAGAVLKPETLQMQISDLYRRSEVALDAIMLHEMLHVYFAIEGDFGEQHGPKFKAMARRLSEKVGFEVPMEDSVDGLELASMDTKPVGVLILEKENGAVSFALFPEKVIRAQLGDIQQRWNYLLGLHFVKKVGVFVVNTQPWTVLTARMPVQRKFTANAKYYVLRDREAVDDPIINGEPLWTAEAPAR